MPCMDQQCLPSSLIFQNTCNTGYIEGFSKFYLFCFVFAFIPVKNFSVILGQLSTKQWRWSELLKDTTPCFEWGLNPQPCDQESNTLCTELWVLFSKFWRCYFVICSFGALMGWLMVAMDLNISTYRKRRLINLRGRQHWSESWLPTQTSLSFNAHYCFDHKLHR